MKLTIGRKLSMGLGVMLAMVITLGCVAYFTQKRVEAEMKSYQDVRKLNAMITARIVDHYKWMDGLASGVFIQGKAFKGKLDPDECDLGKWMATFKPYSEEIAGPLQGPAGAASQTARHRGKDTRCIQDRQYRQRPPDICRGDRTGSPHCAGDTLWR